MRKVLRDDALYHTDNGRIVCGRHAGMMAQYTGCDVSGQRVARVTPKDATAWMADIGEKIECEDCGCTPANLYLDVPETKLIGVAK